MIKWHESVATASVPSGLEYVTHLHDHSAQQAPHDVAAADVGGRDAVRDEVRHRPRVVADDLRGMERRVVDGGPAWPRESVQPPYASHASA
jgi:hypothetical protein